ncbi:hypothetical protein [Sulfuricaulis limicola]|nr:hypothetical protein [Sulfuricaulis limicola]
MAKKTRLAALAMQLLLVAASHAMHKENPHRLWRILPLTTRGSYS